MSFFAKTTAEPIENTDSQLARFQLLGMAAGPAPKQPVRQIAAVDPMQSFAARLASQYMQNPDTRGYDTAMNLAGQFAAGGDPRELSGYRAIMDKVLGQGTAGASNLAGVLRSPGKGYDVLGRKTTGVQDRLTASALPFLSAESGRQIGALQALPQIQGAKERSVTNWTGLSGRLGAMLRDVTQAKNDAEYDAALRNLQFLYELQPGLFQRLLVNPTVYSQYDKGDLGRIQEASDFGKDLTEIYSNTLGMVM